MLNQVICVGRIKSEPKVISINGTDYLQVILSVGRSYKNADGVYENDTIPFVLNNSLSENVLNYCKVGDVVGIKGSVFSAVVKDKIKIYLKGEKVSFLSSHMSTSEEE